MIFTSDNAVGVVEPIWAAMRAADVGAVPSYGGDDLTAALEARVRAVFEAPQARVFLVGTGTAANALALACLCPAWGCILCHELAHIERDECGAPGFFAAGAKLTLLPGPGAKIDPATLTATLAAGAHAPVHAVQLGALSLSQATELGAIYSPAELAALTAPARAAGLGVHLDGTRLANALARSGATPAAMTWRAGVDILCLGATKNGALAAEAVVIFDPARAWEFELRRKRAGHLVSKMRFVAAQMLAWFEDDLWLRLAGQANAMADRLAAGLVARGVAVAQPVQANMIFATLRHDQHRRLTAAGARYYDWPGGDPGAGDDAPWPVRLVCSYATQAAEVEGFLALLD